MSKNYKKIKKKKDFTELDLKGNFLENNFISRPVDKLKLKYPEFDEEVINEILDEVSRNVDEADKILQNLSKKTDIKFEKSQENEGNELLSKNNDVFDINSYDKYDLENNSIKNIAFDNVIDGDIININEYIMTYCFSDEDESK